MKFPAVILMFKLTPLRFGYGQSSPSKKICSRLRISNENESQYVACVGRVAVVRGKVVGMSTLLKLQGYMGERRWMLPGALALSGGSALLGLVPFLCVWEIVHRLLAHGSGEARPLVSLALWAAGTSMASVFLYFFALMLSHLAAFRVETRMRSESMDRIIGMPLGFFDLHPTGKIRKIVDTNAGITHVFLAHQLPDLAGTVLVPVATLVLLLWFDWRIGLASLVPLVFAMTLMLRMMGGKGKSFMDGYMMSLEEMNGDAVEYVRGIPVVKVFQQTVRSFKNFHGSIERYRAMVVAYTRLWETPMSLYVVAIHGIAFFMVPTAVLLIGRGDDPTRVVRDLFLYALVMPLFARCIMRSAYLGQAMGLASQAIESLEKLLDHPPLRVPTTSRRPERFDIDFEDVSFAYPGASSRAVDNISFAVPEGTETALVGPSGSGKTTLGRLVPRFWDVGSGRVRLGGVDVREIDPSVLMRHVSFVFQSTRLAKATIRENLLYGSPGASEADLLSALEATRCAEIVAKLPQGLDTRIGSKGIYLSGGEQQRIVLARALLKDAPVVVLDEATAFADPENEHLIQAALARLMAGRTVLMIAHRLTSVEGADRILVLDRGRIVERGTHAQLRAEGGRYERMWNEYQRSVKWTIKDGSILEGSVQHA